MKFVYHQLNFVDLILLPRWKKRNSVRNSQEKLSALSFDHVLPTYLQMSWTKEDFFITCCKSKKCWIFVGIEWYDLIKFMGKFITSFYRFTSKLCQNTWLKRQYIFKKKKVRNLSAYFELCVPLDLNSFCLWQIWIFLSIRYVKCESC